MQRKERVTSDIFPIVAARVPHVRILQFLIAAFYNRRPQRSSGKIAVWAFQKGLD
jgi:hypothetical protein